MAPGPRRGQPGRAAHATRLPRWPAGPGCAWTSRTADAVRPAAEDPLTRFGLTEREREILVLLAAGRSNPQIAGALFISPKTASVHVSNILAKLGVDSRVEAAAVAHRLGVTG